MIYNKDSGPGFNSVLRVAKLDKKKVTQLKRQANMFILPCKQNITERTLRALK